MKKPITLKINFEDNQIDYNDIKIFAIYSNIHDYELAYWINKELSISMRKLQKETHKLEFSFFFHEDSFSKFQLIKNRVYFEEEKEENLLENFFTMEKKYLCDQKKDIDYFFIMTQPSPNENLGKIISKIKNINGVLMIHFIEKGENNIEYINLDEKIYFYDT